MLLYYCLCCIGFEKVFATRARGLYQTLNGPSDVSITAIYICLFVECFPHLCAFSPELIKPASSLYLHNLTGTLETAVRATNAQFEAADILNRLDVRMLDLSPGDQGWDVFSLHYHVTGPISTVCGCLLGE